MRTNEAITIVGRVMTDDTGWRRGEAERARDSVRPVGPARGHAATAAKNNAGPGARKNVPTHRLAIIQSRAVFLPSRARENLWHTRERYIFILCIPTAYTLQQTRRRYIACTVLKYIVRRVYVCVCVREILYTHVSMRMCTHNSVV